MEPGKVSFFNKMQRRWGVGPWGAIAIFAAFSLAGMAVVRVKMPILAFVLPDNAPRWARWVAYPFVIVPTYQAFLLGFGTLLGQGDFFWKKLKATGRFLAGRRAPKN